AAPAAALGLLVAVLLTPQAVPLASPVWLALLCAVLPAAALVLAAGPLAPSVAEAKRWRWAWVAETAVVGLAVLSVVLLARRGLAPTA
ncbi:hypothetical protein SB775_30545, partial [Peribacillus sp. SIMBA_075]